MSKRLVQTAKAPQAVGPYSQGIIAGPFVFLSGQVGVDPDSKKMVEGGVAAQIRQIFSNIKAILQEAGSDLERVVKVTVFLKDMASFKTLNEVYAEYFNKPYPARSAVAVKELPISAEVEIEAIAYLR